MGLHAANKPPFEHATRLGKTRPTVSAVWAGFFYVFFAQAIPTQIVASWLGYTDWLGKGIVPRVYFPGEYIIWLIRWWQPFSIFMHRPLVMYPQAFKDSFTSLIWSVPLAILVGIVVSIISARFTIPSDDIDPLDAGAKWSDFTQAKKQGLDQEGGWIIGIDPKTGRVLRFSGNQGFEYINPPGNGKTTSVAASLLSRLQMRAALYGEWRVAFRLLGIPLWFTFHKWTEHERLSHPWGEEPLLVITDPKFEYLGWVSGFHHDVLKKRVECIAPLGIPPKGFPQELASKLAKYNPFWSARIGTKDGYQDCLTKSRALINDPNPQGENAFFSKMAETFGAGVVEHCAYVAINTGNYKLFSVPGMLDYIASFKAETIVENGQKREKPGLEVMLEHMKKYPHDLTGCMGWNKQMPNGSMKPTRTKPSIFNAADQMASLADRTRASVYGAFVNRLAIFQGERIRDFCMESTIELDAALDAEQSSTIFIGVDAMNLKEVQGYMRLVQEDVMRVMTVGGTPIVDGRSTRPHKYPWGVVMDEAYAGGYNEVVDHASGFIRGFGGWILLIWQSFAQKCKIYSDSQNRNVINETLGVFQFGPAKTVEGGAYIEDELGKNTRKYVVESVSGDAYSISPLGHVAEQVQTPQAPLVSAKEFTQLPKDHVIAVVDGHNYYLKNPQFFLFPELVKRSKMQPKLSGLNTVTEPFFVRSFRSIIGEEQWALYLEERKKFTVTTVEIELDEDVIVGGSGSFYRISAAAAGTMESAIEIALADYLGEGAKSAVGAA